MTGPAYHDESFGGDRPIAACASDPFAKGGDRRWLWWGDARSLRPGLYLRHRRVLRVSMWLLRPRYSWNVRGYGRRWT